MPPKGQRAKGPKGQKDKHHDLFIKALLVLEEEREILAKRQQLLTELQACLKRNML
jgi:hypothetical protein